MRNMSLDDWINRYKPIYDEDEGTLLEIEFDERDRLRELNEQRVLWTEFHNDTIRPGIFYVNRLRYLVTELPWESSSCTVKVT